MMFVARLKIVAVGIVAAAAIVTAFAGLGVAVAGRRQVVQPPARDEATQAAAKVEPGKTSVAALDPHRAVDQGRGCERVRAPVGGARVSSYWSLDPGVVTTHADGTFAIANHEPRLSALSILATANEGALQGIFHFHDPTTGPKYERAPVRIVLKPARIVTVSVADGRGGPVPGATVSVLDINFPVATGQTDARGNVVLRAPADTISKWIVGFKSGVGFDYFENYRSVPPGFAPPPESARLVLNGVHPVRVKLVDSSGSPVKGVEISPITILKCGKLFTGNVSVFPAGAATNEQGLATLDWFPRDVAEATAMWVVSKSYSMPKFLLVHTEKLDDVVTAQVFRCTPISGKVTRADGSPAAGIRVEAAGAGAAYPAGSGVARTAVDGSYTMDLPPNQSYLVYVVDDDLAAPSQSGVVVREGKPRAGVDFRLGRGSLIHGQVTAGPEAQPAPGVGVGLIEQGPAVPDGTFADQPRPVLFESAQRVAGTDSQGRYAFRVGPGNYEVSGPSEPGERTPTETLKVGDGEEIRRDFRISRLRRALPMVRGVVRAKSSDGATIAGAVVVAEPIGGRRSAQTYGFADAQGRFELPRLFGRCDVYAQFRGQSCRSRDNRRGA